MNAPTRPARRGRKTRSDDTLPAQLDWREIRNHMAPLAPLSDDQIESIHLASLRLLEEYGIELSKLAEEVGKEYGDFDLICHIAYDQPPLTRRERADNVKKRNYFTKYGDQARAVLEALLDKYADEGVLTIESPKVLKLTPFDQMGTPVEIINKVFGGKANYENALQELERELFEQKRTA